MLALDDTPTSAPADPTPIRILVVDDHPFFREGLVAWITRQPNFVGCGSADSPLTALQAIEQLKPDIVLLDIQLREGDGFDLLRMLKGYDRSPRIIVVSQKDEAIFAERSIQAGAHGYVLKDEAIDVMRVAICAVLNGGIHLSTAMRRQRAHPDSTGLTGPIAKLHSLFNRELQVLQLLGRGYTTKEIADGLGISPKTVEYYRENLKRKLGIPDSLSLIRLATIWEYEERFPPQP